MNIFSYGACFAKTLIFPRLSRERQLRIAEKKQKEIIDFARKNSKYYREIIPENCEKLEDIPPTTKKVWMERFDDIVTDPSITFERIWNQYKTRPEDASVDGKYAIVMTSGSTGAPVVILREKDGFIRDEISDSLRCVNGKNGVPIITNRHYTIEREKYDEIRAGSWIARKIVPAVLNCQDPCENIVKELDRLKPELIGGYTSEIKLIAAKCLEAGIRLPLKAIICSGENLTELDKKEIRRAFPDAKVRAMYACTEAGTIASECEYGHLHINEDRLKIEPVDEKFRVLPYGVRSDQTLVTLYAEHIQPLIRYTLGDKVILHNEPCPCGRKTDWVEIQGRSSDLICFDGENGKQVPISPLTIMVNMDDYYSDGVENFSDYQLILHPKNLIELRLAFIEPCDHEAIFEKTKTGLTAFLESQGVKDVDIRLSDQPPEVPLPGKKKRRIYRVEK